MRISTFRDRLEEDKESNEPETEQQSNNGLFTG